MPIPECGRAATGWRSYLRRDRTALGTRFDPDEAEVIERVLRDHGGIVPDQQMISEAALALAIHRRSR